MGGNFHPGFESLSLRHFKNKARGITSGFIFWRNRLIFTLQGDASEIAHIEEVSKIFATDQTIYSDMPIPPGEYLEEALDELGMTKDELTKRKNRPAPN